MAKKTDYKDGVEYVIYSKKKNSIWANGKRISFLTFQAAKSELDRMMSNLMPELREVADWVVEERSWSCEIYCASNNEEGFGDF